LFGLFNAAMGVTTVLPRMDFSRPATVDPRNIVDAIYQWNVTHSLGSPADWNRVGPYCQEHGLRLRSLRRVMSAGAPVPAGVLSSMRAVIHPAGEVHTPYGATESLPVATIAASEVLTETWPLTEQGRGVCVGRRFPGIEWRVVQVVDGPIPTIDDAESLPTGVIGELIVRGPVVTTEYAMRRDANALVKILECGPGAAESPFSVSPLPASQRSLKSKAVMDYRTPQDAAAPFWHRMGDCGYLDEHERFWFCGRLSQRVVAGECTMYTIPTEAQFNRSSLVSKSALVGIGPRGQQQPAIVLELNRDGIRRGLREPERQRLASEMRATMQESGVRHLLVYPRELPVDIRHNAKIFREQLAVWAARQLKRRRPSRSVVLRDVL
jgi:acyl-CoA synthetase (AMP-forming)/AMP-acid ligase II